MTIKEVLKKFPEIETELLLEHVLNQPKEFLFTHDETKLTPAQLKEFKTLANKRLSGLPMAYVLGYKYFFGMKIAVNRSVLIPRPETEWLVSKALSELKRLQKNGSKSKRSANPIKIIDVGTGSGAISIAIAKKNSDTNPAEIHASDISEKALVVAQKNAKTHDAKIQFYHKNLLAGFRKKFDIIIANLPYVPLTNYIILKEGLKHEPKHAITDGTDVSALIALFVPQAIKALSKQGVILLEIDPSSQKVLRKTMAPLKKFKITFTKDYNKLVRYAVIRRK